MEKLYEFCNQGVSLLSARYLLIDSPLLFLRVMEDE